MSHERKVDVSGIWGKQASSDIDETRRARRSPPAPATPLVNVNHAYASVITIGNVSDRTLATLLALPQQPGETP